MQDQVFEEVLPRPQLLPCGGDCAHASAIPGDVDGRWHWCGNVFPGGVVRDGRECPYFKSRVAEESAEAAK